MPAPRRIRTYNRSNAVVSKSAAENNLLAVNFSAHNLAAETTPTSGTVYWMKMAWPQTLTVSNIVYYVSASPALTAGNYAGIYTVSGTTATQRAVTADSTTPWDALTSAAAVTAVTTPVTIQGGSTAYVYIAFLWTGGTLANTVGSQAGAYLNVNTTTSTGLRAATGAIAQATLPATYDITGMGALTASMWCGVS